MEPGDKLNLDAKKIAAFRELKSAGKDGPVPVKEVEVLVRQGLLARYQAYHTKGLPGIAPYERGSRDQRSAGDELLLSTKQLTGVAKHLPVFYNFMLNYPNGLTKDEAMNLEEFFYWLNIDVFGRPTYVLVHRMLYHVDDDAFTIERTITRATITTTCCKESPRSRPRTACSCFTSVGSRPIKLRGLRPERSIPCLARSPHPISRTCSKAFRRK